MLKRILTGVIAIPVSTFILFAWGGNLFALAILVLAVLGTNEYYRAVRKSGRAAPIVPLGLVASAALIVAAWYGGTGTIVARVLTAAVLMGLIAEIFRKSRSHADNIGSYLVGITYASWLLTHILFLRKGFPGQISVEGIPGTFDRGAYLVLFTLLIIWATDTFAYFSGKFLGKRKLCPALSPGKTVVGAVGGFLGAVIVGGFVGHWFQIPLAHALTMGVIAGIFSQLGDLVESALKRDLGVKDFGTLFPGHGGALDRLDSTLVVAPIIYGYLRLIMGWGG